MISISEEVFEQGLIGELIDLGYEHLYGPDVPRVSNDYRDAFLFDTLEISLHRINRGLPKVAIREVIRIITDVSDGSLYARNERFHEYLQSGVQVSFFDGKEQTSTVVKLLDYENPMMNEFHVVNQWTFIENQNKRPDVILFVNGMPLVVFELKSPSREDVDSSDAYLQIRNYLQAIPSLFVPNVFCVLSDSADTRVGTITAPEDRFVQWKSVDGTVQKRGDIRVLVRGMCAPERLLDIIHNFVCFSNSSDSTVKILAGYHQYFAVKKAIECTKRAVGNDGKVGVFWHTQGSGKSLSMVFYARLLQQVLNQPTIVVITDRNDLDQQLFTQFSRCKSFLRQDAQQAQSQKNLIQLLNNRQAGGIIFTTMQKFIENNVQLSDRQNIIVMADEAHRSQYGLLEELENGKVKMGAAGWVRKALPNASFIGFTGTPISTRDKNTREIFGNYIDVYDMTQAVEDGATRPVYYESRVVALKLEEEVLSKLDELFKDAEENVYDERLERQKKSFSSLDAVLSTPTTITTLTSDIINHYETNRADLLTGKAMVVAYSRSVGIKIYQEMLKQRPEWKEKVAVVMTGGNQDPEEWFPIIGNDNHKKDLAKRFKDDKSPLKIVIVVDMWLTGFDVPSLSTMYIFKPMKGHNLMQSIARVNRVFKGKEGGLIVDYIGIGNALKQAMADYTKRDQDHYGEMDVGKTAYPQFQNKLSVCRDFFYQFEFQKALNSGDERAIYTAVLDGADFILDHQKDEDKKEFANQARLMDMALSLCKSLSTKAEQLEAAYYRAVRKTVVQHLLPDSGVQPKLEMISIPKLKERLSEIMAQGVQAEGVLNLFEDKSVEISLFDDSFLQEVANMKQKNLAVEMLKRLIKGKIVEFKKQNITKSEQFSTMLQKTVNGYLNRQLTSAQVIEELVKMAQEILKGNAEATKLGLTDEEMAFYDALTQPQAIRDFYENDELIGLTKELTEALRKNSTIDWQKKESARAGMRRMIKRLLKRYKYPPEEQPVAMDTLMRQCELWADNSTFMQV